MKIAVVLYGQPRDYMAGYTILIDFLIKQNIEFDFFYHCWVLKEGQTYSSSKNRYIDSSSLEYKSNIQEVLKDLYKPLAFEYEYQIDEFDKNKYYNTIAYNNKINMNINPGCITNNIVSSIYSRTKARNILNDYINKTNTYYDFVVITRFDFTSKVVRPLFNFRDLDTSKIYVSRKGYPRKIILDFFIVCPLSIFLQWFVIYDNLREILDSEKLSERMKQLNEGYIFNTEEIVTMSYLYNFDTTSMDKFEYYSQIYDFND